MELNLTGYAAVFFTQEGKVIYDQQGSCADNAMQTLASLEIMKQKIIAHKIVEKKRE